MDTQELLLTSCRQPQNWSACLWNPVTGNSLHQYKNGGTVAPKSVNFIGNDYFLTADEEKPLTHIWPINSQEPTKKLGTILPEKATTLALCPKSCYLAAGINTRLYIWHVSSGKLFTVQKKNYQPITCVKFSSDGIYVLVAGEDGMMLVYDLINLVSFHKNYLPQTDVGQVEPEYTKQDHSMPIMDFHTGIFGHESRLATVSSDNTCKLYTLATGDLLLTLVFEEPLTSVVFDKPCWNLFVGSNSGKIQQFTLKEPPRPMEYHVGKEDLLFKGHQKRITCLDLSVMRSVLVSGAEDNFVYIWDIPSRQILKTIEHKGAITNVLFVIGHENFFAQNFKPKFVVKSLDREVIQGEEFVDCRIQDYDIEVSDDDDDDDGEWGGTTAGSSKQLEAENARLRAANKELYDTALKLSQKYNDFK